MGYLCQAATCSYGGRDWKVYYTDRIPLPYGPWKLAGTPGLILKAMDTENNFVFESVGLTQKSAPIIRYDWDRRKMKKDEWRKYERRIYEQAGVFGLPPPQRKRQLVGIPHHPRAITSLRNGTKSRKSLPLQQGHGDTIQPTNTAERPTAKTHLHNGTKSRKTPPLRPHR